MAGENFVPPRRVGRHGIGDAQMGCGEAALVTKISGSSTSLCLVNGTRIALNHRAAMNILVECLPANAR